MYLEDPYAAREHLLRKELELKVGTVKVKVTLRGSQPSGEHGMASQGLVWGAVGWDEVVGEYQEGGSAAYGLMKR